MKGLRGQAALLVLTALGCSALSACVASNAGERQVQTAVEQRLGTQLPSLHATGEAKKLAARLLQEPLDAQKAAQVALLHSPRAALALSVLSTGRARAMGLHRWPNPHAELGVRFGAESPTLDLGATLDLTEMLLLGYRVPEGKAELAAAQAESIQALLGVAHTAKRALFVQQANLAAATLEERVFQAIDAALETTRAMHEAGNATDLELARQEAAAAEASLRSLDAKAEVKAGDQQLRSILAVGQAQDSLRIAAELPALPPTEPSWVDAEQKALARNLQIEAAKQHEAAAEEAQSGAWVRGVLPRLGVGVGAEREDDNWSVGPMLELEVPLFYQGQAERAAAAARAAEAEAVRREAMSGVRADVRLVLLRLNTSRQRVQRYETQLLPKRREILRQSLLQYNAMSLGVFQLLDAQRALNTSEIAHIAALRDYWLARTDLAQLLAGARVQPAAPAFGARTQSDVAPAAGH